MLRSLDLSPWLRRNRARESPLTMLLMMLIARSFWQKRILIAAVHLISPVKLQENLISPTFLITPTRSWYCSTNRQKPFWLRICFSTCHHSNSTEGSHINPVGGLSFLTKYLSIDSWLQKKIFGSALPKKDYEGVLNAIYQWGFERIIPCHGDVLEGLNVRDRFANLFAKYIKNPN